MSFDAQAQLPLFVQRLLTLHGAEVEMEGARLHVVLPDALARDLGLPEFCALHFEDQNADGYTVQYGQPLLEKMAAKASRDIPFAGVRVIFDYVKQQGFERLLGEQFAWANAVGRVENSAETRCDYLLLNCRYLAQSDEQKEDLLPMGLNLETGAPCDQLAQALEYQQKEVEKGLETISARQLAQVLQWVNRHAPQVLEPHIRSFRESMDRRLRRDVANLQEYYNGLRQEMQAALKRPGLSEALIRDRREKIDLIPEELAAKKEDLIKKYSIKVSIRLCAAMRIRTPAVKVLFGAAIGRDRRQLSLTYNPIVKAFDPLVCEGCGRGTFAIHFCARRHLLCPWCATACPVCA